MLLGSHNHQHDLNHKFLVMLYGENQEHASNQECAPISRWT